MKQSGIENLSLAHNHLGDQGVGALFVALAQGALPLLRSLKLADNPKIGNPGLQSIAEHAPKLSKLRILKLEGCGGDLGSQQSLRHAVRAAQVTVSF